MKELYLEVFSNVSEEGICFVPLETAIILFVYEYCQQPPILITLIYSPALKNRPRFRIRLPQLLFEILDEEDVDMPGSLCRFPSIVVGEGTTCVSGLCSTLRQVVGTVDARHPLLGFKQSCLWGCAETSTWTRFCEIDMIETVNDLFRRSSWEADFVVVPENVVTFEFHMGKPVKTHNIEKEKQNVARAAFSSPKHQGGERELKLLDLEHTYCEGHKISLADFILLPCFHLFFELLGCADLRKLLPLTYKWYENMMTDEKVSKSVKLLAEVENLFQRGSVASYVMPEVKNVDLYKTRRKNSKAKHIFTRQSVIEATLKKIPDFTNENIITSSTFGNDIAFEWSSVPTEIQLGEGRFPRERSDRKSHQLENMIRAALKIAQNGNRIVDFCSGRGYLGLMLAYLLPSCTVTLLENKEESLKGARECAARLNLSNVMFCQSNVDYFRGEFDIGVSLHACGSAADLVVEKVLLQNASFVCCPCCYGSIQPNHIVQYPRSQVFRNLTLTVEEYLTLAHSSDQTHDENNEKTSQGKKCMNVIDIDRCLRVKERGYDVYLSTFEPSSCTPKNNLLVGIPHSRNV